MNDELRKLCAEKNSARTLMEFKADRARTLARSIDAPIDEQVAADLAYERAVQASYEAELAYKAALTEYAKANNE